MPTEPTRKARDKPAQYVTSPDEMMKLCERLQNTCLNSPIPSSLEFSKTLRRFHVELSQLNFGTAKQAKLTCGGSSEKKACKYELDSSWFFVPFI
jgi:hypothetical protein